LPSDVDVVIGVYGDGNSLGIGIGATYYDGRRRPRCPTVIRKAIKDCVIPPLLEAMLPEDEDIAFTICDYLRKREVVNRVGLVGVSKGRVTWN
jgi:hypothetical protein